MSFRKHFLYTYLANTNLYPWKQDLSKTYEQELQLEDEQYIQPEGLSGHQVGQNSRSTAVHYSYRNK